MQYIGQLISTAKHFCSDLNSATLIGAIDVIVVQHSNGQWVSSPFYVQFGKTGILRPSEDEVEISINGTICEFIKMRLNHYGQAYFDFRPPPDDESNSKCSAANSDTGVTPDDPVISSGEVLSPTLRTNESMFDVLNADKFEESALIKSLPILYQSVNYNEFQLNIEWWQSKPCNSSKKIQLYRIPEEHFEACCLVVDGPRQLVSSDHLSIQNCSVSNDAIWVYWENSWFSWKAAAIRLRVMRSLNKPVPECLEKKLMESDRENPAFTMLPEFPPPESTDFQVLLPKTPPPIAASPSWSASDNCSVDANCREEHKSPGDKVDRNEHQPGFFSLGELRRRLGYSSSSDPGEGLDARKHIRHNSGPSCDTLNNVDVKPSPTQCPEKKLVYYSDGYEIADDEVTNCKKKVYRHWERACNHRAFNLSSEELKGLDLKDGLNEAVFTVTNKFQGTVSCYCLIYLWKSTDKIVISDIDGTITKSDILGHIMPLVGLEWTHSGVTHLYRQIVQNDFRIMYVTARAIGQAATTRKLLEELTQDKEYLPPGPVILSPNSLLTTINWEMIKKRPQELKIASLRRICRLFQREGENPVEPFVAGFGNRATDVDTYRAVGIVDEHIFIVNPSGELTTPTGISMKLGYRELHEVVNLVFPPPAERMEKSTTFSDFAFWHDGIPSLEVHTESSEQSEEQAR